MSLLNLSLGADTVVGQDYSFHSFTSEQGLTSNAVFSILQDRQGFVWFGTGFGLNRFDAYTFKDYSQRTRDPNGVIHSRVNSLYQDHSGLIWVGTEDGLCQVDPRTEVMCRVVLDTNSKIKPPSITSLAEDLNGTLWVGTDRGLYCSDAYEGMFRCYRLPEVSETSSPHITALHIAGENLWVGTKSGLYRLQFSQGQWQYDQYDPNDPCGIGHASVLSITQDSAGLVWVGTMGGIYVYDPEKQAFIPPWGDLKKAFSLQDTFINSLCWDDRGSLWIGTRGQGLYVFDKKRGTLQQYKHDIANGRSLSWDVVTALCKDDAGNIWIGTYGRGVNLWHPVLQRVRAYVNEPHNPDSLGVESVLSLYEDRMGLLWVAGYGPSTLDIMDMASGRCEHVGQMITQGKGHIRVICEDPSSHGTRLWLGVENNPAQLMLVDRTSRCRIKAYDLRPLVQESLSLVDAIYPDDEGILWIGTDKGLFRFRPETEQWSTPVDVCTHIPALLQKWITCLFKDSYGRFWVGTQRGGLFQLDKGEGGLQCLAYHERDWQAGRFGGIGNIIEDLEHNIWVSTAVGVECLKQGTRQFEHYTEAHGLATNVTSGLLIDRDGAIWVGASHGLSHYVSEPGHHCMFTSYHIDDGLHSNEFFRGACRLRASGRLCFGGRNGVSVIDPESVYYNAYAPPIVLTDFRLFNEPVPIVTKQQGRSILSEPIETTSHVSLSHRENVITLGFAALNYILPQRNQYAYRMEGLDTDWNYVGTQRRVTYSGLKPGHYIFQVKGSNNDGIWNEAGVSLGITIRSPFWATWPFRISLFLLLVGVLFMAYRYKTWRMRRQTLQLESLVQKRTEELDTARCKAEQASQVQGQLLARVRTLGRELTEAQEKERTRISYQLHDSVAQDICAIKFGLETYSHSRKTSLETLRDKTAAYADMLSDVVTSIRDLSYELRPPALTQLGLIPTLQNDFRNITEQTGIDIDFRVDGLSRSGKDGLSPEMDISLYRMIQEGLSNIRRHAKATKVLVRLVQNESGINLMIQDNGRGLPQGQYDSPGLGLSSIQHRVHLFGGEMILDSSKTTGTKLIIKIPLLSSTGITRSSHEK